MTLKAELHFYVGHYVQRVHTCSGAHRALCSVGIGVKTAERGVEIHLYLSICFPVVHGTTLSVPYATIT
jgi:hypothetical protein